MRFRLLRVVGLLFTPVLIVLGLLVVLVSIQVEIDATPYRDRLATLVEEQTGLAVRLDGELWLITGPTAGLRLGGLRVSNPRLAGSEPILATKQLALRVETSALLSGSVKPVLAEIERGELVLARDENGRGSWQTGAEVGPEIPAPDLSGLLTDGLTLRITDSAFRYSDQQSGSAISAHLTRALAEPEGNRLGIDLDGLINGHPVRLTGSTTTLSQLIAADSAVLVRLSGDVMGLKVVAEGTLAPPGSGHSNEANLKVSGASLAGLAPWLGDAAVAGQPVKAELALHGSGDSYHIETLKLATGGQRISARGDVALAEAQRVELRNAEVSYRQDDGGRTWELAVDSASLSPGADPTPFRISGRLLGLAISASGLVDRRAKQPAIDAEVEVSGASLAGLEPWLGDAAVAGRPVKAELALNGSGDSYHIETLKLALGRQRISARGDVALAEVSRVEVRNAEVSYQQDDGGRTWQLDVDSAALSPAADPTPFRISGRLLGLAISASGSFDRRANEPAIDAEVEVSGASLAGLGPWIGTRLASLGPVSSRLDLEARGRVFDLAPIALGLGEDRLDGRIALDVSGERPSLDLDLSGERLDLAPLLPAEPAGLAEAGEAGDDKGLFPRLLTDAPFRLDWMNAADIQGGLHVRRLVMPHRTWADVDIRGKMHARTLHLELAGEPEGGGGVTAALDLDAGQDLLTAGVRLDGRKLRIEPLIVETAAKGMIDGELNVSVSVSVGGASPAALKDSLSGSLVLLVGQARADLTELNRLTPGVRSLLGQLVRREEHKARVNCAVAALDFRSGRSDVSVLIDSRDSTVVADGTLDLAAETLDIHVVPQPKGANLKVAAPIFIDGSLRSPRVRVQRAGVLVSLAELVSRVAVPQLLLVDAFGEVVADNPCVHILTGAEALPEAQGPVQVLSRPVKATVKGAGKVVEGTGKVVKGVGEALIEGTGAILKGIGGAAEGIIRGGEAKPREDPPSMLDEQ